MNAKRLSKTAILLVLGFNLASCGSFVADHWPHWAGGMPDDVPPRPGAPGYADFIAHGQVKQEAANPAAPANATPAAAQVAPEQAPAPARPAPVAAQVRAATPQEDLSEDPSVVKGGLY
jgi:hypothetical protein